MTDGAPNLDQKNPIYDLDSPERVEPRDLFTGRRVVKEEGKTYLPKFDNESDSGYAARLKRAVYNNWPETVIESRQAMLWRKAPVRTGIDDDALADVDNEGTPVDTFFASRTEDAQVDGLHFVLVDQTKRSEKVVSKADEQAAGMKTYFLRVPADSVYDWQFGADCKLDWVVIASTRTEDRPECGQPIVTVEQRTCWTRNDWTLYEANSDQSSESAAWTQRGETTPHPVGEVPLVDYYGKKIVAFRGKSMVSPIVDHTLASYNKYSDRDTAERLANNPKLWMSSPEKPETFDASSDKGLWMQSRESVTNAIGYLEPAGTGLEASRKSEFELVRQIFEIALKQAKRDSAQVQSEDAMKQERETFNASLASASGQYERAEQRCWEFWQKWEKKTGQITIDYNSDFDDKSITAQMLSAFSTMVADDQMQLETFLGILEEGEVLPANVDIKAEVKALETKADQSAAKALEAIRRNAAVDDEDDEGNLGSANGEP